MLTPTRCASHGFRSCRDLKLVEPQPAVCIVPCRVQVTPEDATPCTEYKLKEYTAVTTSPACRAVCR